MMVLSDFVVLNEHTVASSATSSLCAGVLATHDSGTCIAPCATFCAEYCHPNTDIECGSHPIGAACTPGIRLEILERMHSGQLRAVFLWAGKIIMRA